MSGNRIYDTRTLGLDPKVVATFPKRCVLVVDDHPDTVDAEALLLEMLGQTVLRAYDGASALRLARERRPEIVFLDIDMPKMNGLEVARELRRIDGMANARVVAYTGFARDEYRAVTFAAGFDDFIMKPATLTNIISILTHV